MHRNARKIKGKKAKGKTSKEVEPKPLKSINTGEPCINYSHATRPKPDLENVKTKRHKTTFPKIRNLKARNLSTKVSHASSINLCNLLIKLLAQLGLGFPSRRIHPRYATICLLVLI